MQEEIYEIIRGAVGARKRAGRVPECVLRLNMLKQHPQLHAHQWDQPWRSWCSKDASPYGIH